MNMAIDLAKKGIGKVNPNPLVGAVIVRDSEILSCGYHKGFGEYHAEREAINSAKVSLEGATIYVNLEPCCHHGKTPPCTDVIIESGIKKVVIGSLDPNLLVAGKGVKLLENAGIEVVCGVLEDECNKLNQVFFNYINKEKPYIILKYAMTMDGKIACYSGKSQWITGKIARNKVHEDRKKYMAIMVGIGTVLSDDPTLNCRCEDPVHPIRIICDSNLRIPIKSNIVKTSNDYKTIIVTKSKDVKKIKELEEYGCQILQQTNDGDSINLKSLIVELGKMGIDSILIEGGSGLNWSALNSNIVDKVQIYIGNKIFGGLNAKSPVGGSGIENPNKAFNLSRPEITILGDDILLESEVFGCLQE